MNIDQAIDKARKLLALSSSDNANEAAAAARQAQALLDRYEISQTMLELEGEVERSDEPIGTTADDPLATAKSIATWRKLLVHHVAAVNGCETYVASRGRRAPNELHLIGRRSDVAKVRYLYAYLTREVDRLTNRDGRGRGRTWRNNFRVGAAETIVEALQTARAEAADELRRAAGADSRALVRVDDALAELERRDRALAAWIAANLRLRSTGSRSFRSDSDGRAAGRVAGREVSVGSARAALGPGQAKIGGRHG